MARSAVAPDLFGLRALDIASGGDDRLRCLDAPRGSQADRPTRCLVGVRLDVLGTVGTMNSRRR